MAELQPLGRPSSDQLSVSSPDMSMTSERQEVAESAFGSFAGRALRSLSRGGTALVVLCGLVMACSSAFFDLTVEFVQQLRVDVLARTPGVMSSLALWSAVVLALAAGSFVLAHAVEPAAVGSGVPEMKSIAGGARMPRALSWKALVSKVFGLLLAKCSGMAVGSEGPNIHIAAIYAAQLMVLPPFREFAKSETMRNSLLVAAGAIGVSATFGTPIAGVLLAVELISSYFSVRTYWLATSGTITAAMVYRFLWGIAHGTNTLAPVALVNTPPTMGFSGLAVCVILGVVCGFLSVGIIKITSAMGSLNRSLHRRVLWGRVRASFLAVLGVALLSALLTFPRLLGKFAALSNQNFLKELFSPGSLDSTDLWKFVPYPGVGTTGCVAILVAVRLLMTVLTITLPFPCGLFMPLMVSGATLGRLIGDLSVLLVHEHVPGVMSMVGCVVLTASCTHTFSSAVVILEMTGDTFYLLPVVVSTTVAISISQFFTVSIFERLQLDRDLPCLPPVKPFLYARTVLDLTAPVELVIEQETTATVLNDALQRASTSAMSSIPVVAGPNESFVGVCDVIAAESLSRVRGQRGGDESVTVPSRTEWSVECTTSLFDLHTLFGTVARGDRVFVTRGSRLVGQVTRQHLRDTLLKWDFGGSS